MVNLILNGVLPCKSIPSGIRTSLISEFLTKTAIRHKTPLKEALREQIRIVAHGHGMTSFRMMNEFIEAMPLVMALPRVSSEAASFSQALTKVKDSPHFHYSYLLNPGVLTDLHVRNYPTLYSAAMMWAKKESKLFENFETTKLPVDTTKFTNLLHPTGLDVQIMNVRALRTLGLSKEDMRSMKKKLEIAGQSVALPSSSDSSSDEEEQEKAGPSKRTRKK